MGILSKKEDTRPPSPTPPTAKPKHGLFSSHRNSTASTATSGTTTTTTSHSTGSTGGGVGGLFGRKTEDSSITAARQRVIDAEAAEHAADRALANARTAVKEAREHVRVVEREAAEEARLAKIKQEQAAEVGRRAKPLGRHGVFH